MFTKKPFKKGMGPTNIAAIYARSATTTWNPSDKNSAITLSNGNLTADWTNASSGYELVRAIANHSTGKFYAEFSIDSNTGPLWNVGVAVAAQPTNTLVGNGTDGICYFPGNGQVDNNFSTITTIQTGTAGQTVCMAVDLGGSLFWWRINAGNWNNSSSANPATGTGGLSPSSLAAGPYYPAWAGHDGPPNDQVTANFGGSAYSQTAPSGFGNW